MCEENPRMFTVLSKIKVYSFPTGKIQNIAYITAETFIIYKGN